MRIFTEYTLWFVPIFVLVGVGVSWLLYRSDVKLKDAPVWARRLMFCLRAFTISALLFLLLAPFLEMRKNRVEKPTIVVLHDNSASLVLQKDSTWYRTEYLSNYQDFLKKLRADYSVDEYQFSDVLTQDSALLFTGKETNISNALQDVATQYFNKNIGAVVLATDGIYNSGENPKYAIRNFPAHMPIYSVALGDTVQECDNLISKVLHNQIAFRDNPFVVKLSVESHALKGKTSKISIYENDKVVYESSFVANDEHTYKTVDCRLKSSQIGKKIYTVKVEYHDGEISERNNSYSFAVDVLESRQKIALVYGAVHPDVAALRRAIESNKNYECTVYSVNDDNIPDVREFNCVVLVGLPGTYGKGKTILNELVKAEIPTLIVYNSGLSFENLNAQHVGVEFIAKGRTFDEVKPNLNADFSLFSLDEQSKELLQIVPPLVAPYGSYKLDAKSTVFASQMVGNLSVDRPLVAFSLVQNTKVGFILAEGLWRWRMYDYKEHASFYAFDSFVNKLVTYLALSEKRELFAVHGESVFSDNQNISFTAELYDKSFEPMPNQDIAMVIRNEDGTEYPFSFSSTDNFYTLNSGKFPQGTYTYTASVTVDSKEMKRTGSFYVLPLLSEYKQTCANHEVLRELAMQTQARMFYPNQFDELLQEIQHNQNIVSVSRTARSRNALIDFPIVLILIVLTASLEWFLRKYYASY
ncbi:MAG: hypothetical protein IK117_06350 [Bacteroidales bacterium]|nr:hypothetical protein [Bacteroidales bacterium]